MFENGSEVAGRESRDRQENESERRAEIQTTTAKQYSRENEDHHVRDLSFISPVTALPVALGNPGCVIRFEAILPAHLIRLS